MPAVLTLAEPGLRNFPTHHDGSIEMQKARLGRNRRTVGRPALVGLMVASLAPIAPLNAQTTDGLTPVPPNQLYTVLDKNGVSLSNGSLDVKGPTISIGDPGNGGLLLAPTILGNMFISCKLRGCGQPFVSGFMQTDTNLTSSVTIGGYRWEKMPSTYRPVSITTTNGIARFYQEPSVSLDLKEYSPVVGRSLTRIATTERVDQYDTGDRLKFIDSDGTEYVYLFHPNACVQYTTCGDLLNGFQPMSGGGTDYSFPVQTITKPNGLKTSFYYFRQVNPYNQRLVYDLRGISTNKGYAIKFNYTPFSMAGINYAMAGTSPGLKVAAVAFNQNTETCDLVASSCNFAQKWPIILQGEIVNSSGYNETYTGPDGDITAVRFWRPIINGSTSNTVGNGTITRPNGKVQNLVYDITCARIDFFVNCPAHSNQDSPFAAYLTFPTGVTRIRSFKDGISTWSYNNTYQYSLMPGTSDQYYITSHTLTVTNPDGTSRNSTAVPTGQLTSSRDEANRITSYTVVPIFDPQEGRLLEQIKPQGNKTGFQYDARGNVTTKTEFPLPGQSIASLVTTFAFPAQCTNSKTCNLPTSVTDPNGNVTSYEYDPTTGLVTKVTYPPDQQGLVRIKRLSYRSISASRLGSPGTYVRDMGPIWLLDKLKECRSSQTLANGCAAGSADEVTTTFGYGSDTGPNNLNPIEVVVASEGVSRRTCLSYDRMGRKISETLPRADLGTCP